jgi:hypothetical protein
MKTTEQIKTETLNYLNKTSLHLFKKDKTLMKVIPYTIEDKHYYLMITIDENGENLKLKVKELFTYEIGPNYTSLLSKSYGGIFYDGYGKKWGSIKHFNAMNRLISYVYSTVLINGLTESVEEEIKNNWEKYKIVWTEKK